MEAVISRYMSDGSSQGSIEACCTKVSGAFATFSLSEFVQIAALSSVCDEAGQKRNGQVCRPS
jgi:hypothetical protein